MPYRKRSEFNAALKGITPPVSVNQANQIARVADALKRKGTAKNPWGAAIALFKRSRKKGKRWSMPKEQVMEINLDLAANLAAQLEEADVAESETVDVEEMDFNALSMQQQIAHIKSQFYKFIKSKYGMNDYGYYYSYYCPDVYMDHPSLGTVVIVHTSDTYKAVSFTLDEFGTASFAAMDDWEDVIPTYALVNDTDDLEEAERRKRKKQKGSAKASYTKKRKKVGETEYESTDFLVVADEDDPDTWVLQYKKAGKYDHALMKEAWSALHAANCKVTDKDAAIKRLKAAFLLEKLDIPLNESADTVTSVVAELHESDVTVNVEEGYIDFVLYEKGWGNTRDNNYYGDEACSETEASKFEGLKMYEVEHDATDRDNKRWVATIKESGRRKTATGSPIARAYVHVPDFFERAKNLKAGDLLHKLQTSIVARAKVLPDAVSEGARVGHKVMEFVKPRFVDFVNAAGAGGRVIDLYEAEADYDLVTVEALQTNRPDIVESLKGDLQMDPKELIELKETVTELKTMVESMSTNSTATIQATRQEAVRATVNAVEDLPEKAKQRIIAQFDGKELKDTYEADVQAAITAEKEYVGSLQIGSGVSNLGESTNTSITIKPIATIEQVQEAQKALDLKYGIAV
jgi:hypothetical protein